MSVRFGGALLAALVFAAACGGKHAPSSTDSQRDDAAILSRTERERGLAPLPDQPPARAEFLRGLRICIDPGHGGDIGEPYESQGYKRGPTGFREAVANLRTSQELATLLRGAGAEVLLTREDDTTVTLEDRARMAGQWRADLFLSVHHNAAASPKANYSSVWYHMDGEAYPASLDVARALADSLARNVALPDAKPTGIYSDRLIYSTGFAVLRHATVPAVLAECSFFTNPEEERLLRIPAYNRRVAYALFLGLSDWAANGVPRWSIVAASPDRVVVNLEDGMKETWGSKEPRIREGTVRVALGGKPVAGWKLKDGELTIPIPPGTAPDALLDVRFENRAKNSSVTVARPLDPVGVPPP